MFFSAFKRIFVSLIFSLTIVSCASTKQEETFVPTEEILQKESIVSTIANFMIQENIEGAFYRMDTLFRQQTTFQEFNSAWQSITSEKGNLVDYTIDSSQYNNLDFYKSINVTYNFENSSL